MVSPGCSFEYPSPLSTVCGGSQFLLFMGILDTFLHHQCDINDANNRPTVEHTPPGASLDDATFDYIVVGAGGAGAVVASRLSANPRIRVLLLEAGGYESTAEQVPALFLLYIFRSSANWHYQTRTNGRSYARNHLQPIWIRGRSLGGSTAINGMQYLRGTREDFESWSALGNRGWSYDEVLPYFLRAEDHRNIELVDPQFHATGGAVPVSVNLYQTPLRRDLMRAAVQSGFADRDLNGANSTGAMYPPMTVLDGVRASTSRAYLLPDRGRRNLHIRLRTQVTRVLIDALTKRASGVEAMDCEGNRLRFYVIREVILSAGSIESPKLLMHSGIGSASHLRRFGIRPIANRPGVGRNLQNHSGIEIHFRSTTRNQTTINWAMATEYLLSRGGPLATLGPHMYVRYRSKHAWADGQGVDLQLDFVDKFTDPLLICSRTGAVDEGEPTPLTLVASSMCYRPLSSGRVELASADPTQPPLIWFNELADEHDVDVIVEGIRMIFRILDAPALREYGLQFQRHGDEECARHEYLSDAYWRCAVRQNTLEFKHTAGTCRMAPPSDKWQVVDEELRVYGVRGLRVVDASVMPNVVAANTMATTTMIGEKGAQMVLDDWESDREV